jgi:hypothetical protein
MSSWVEDDARLEALVYRDGPEVWRNLKVSLQQAVADYTKIYTPAGEQEVEYTDCRPVTTDCVRIRIIPPPGKGDTSFEIRFSLEEKRIKCADSKAQFTLAVQDEQVILQNEDGKAVSPEDVSRAILKPLFDKLPRRKPNILP